MMLWSLLAATLAAEPVSPDAMPFDATPPPAEPAGPLTREAWSKLPSQLKYNPGMEIPPYYELKRRPLTGLIVTGGPMLGGLYLLGMPFAITDSLGYEGDLWPLFIPVVGPFAAIGTFGTPPPSTAILIVDGLAQVAGLSMVVAGASTRVEKLERIPFDKITLGVRPLGNGGQAIVVVGTF